MDWRFAPDNDVRAFGRSELAEMRTFAPEALAMPFDTALWLGDLVRHEKYDLRSVRTAIIIFTGLRDGMLDERQRDTIWKLFGLPIFEQLRGPNGRIMARECEVHAGLHLDPHGPSVRVTAGEMLLSGVPTGLDAEFTRDRCECGDESPRVLRLSRARRRAQSRAAAAAA